jgi:hypothetical protein
MELWKCVTTAGISDTTPGKANADAQMKAGATIIRSSWRSKLYAKTDNIRAQAAMMNGRLRSNLEQKNTTGRLMSRANSE